METFTAIIPSLILLAIPISVAIRIFAALFSVRVRESITQHPIAHLIWLAAGITIVILTLLLPPLKRHSLNNNAVDHHRFTLEHAGSPCHISCVAQLSTLG
jgi:hypothetical protein